MAQLDTVPLKELIGQYRQVFSSPHGKVVLNHMLWELGLFDEIGDDPESIALKNYATRLLHILSGSKPGGESIQGFLDNLMRQPLPKEKE